MRFLSLILAFVVCGCTANTAPAPAAGAKVTTAMTTVAGDAGDSRSQIAAAGATLVALTQVPGLPPGASVLIGTLSTELSDADSPLSRLLSKDLPAVGAESNAALLLQNQQIEQLQSKEHQWYLFFGALAAGIFAGLGTIALIEANVPGGTTLLSITAGGLVGAIVFAVAGYVIPDVAKTIRQEITIFLWAGGAIVAILAGWWIYNRIKTGSWGGALHSALAPAAK